ncbi:UTRA domain-containing protein, partial [Haploplasma modicum]|uniref:UTRA domain-containing protein n=1 Tax=Haploplasma modicum TaxID=2150 RepID=UPI00214B5DD2
MSQIKIEKNIQGLRGFTDEMESLGRVVRSEVVGFEIIDQTDDIKDKLFLTNGEDKVIYIELVRYGDEIPVLHEELYIPHYLFKELTIEDLGQSFYLYLENEKELKKVLRQKPFAI